MQSQVKMLTTVIYVENDKYKVRQTIYPEDKLAFVKPSAPEAIYFFTISE